MKSAILNSALPYMTANTDPGVWLSVTHFQLAWVSTEERLANPVTENMSELVQQSPSDGKVKGDIIYNIWQTPFSDEQYAGSFYSLKESYAKYFQYEYDSCNKKNILKSNQTNPNVNASNWPSDLSSNSFPYGFSLDGYVNPSASTPNPTQAGSELTEANIPYYLDYSVVENQHSGVTTFSKLFPIKSYHRINGDDASSTIVNYNLNLPAISSSIADQINFYANAIGNFKFNRVGLYMTVCTKTDPTTGTGKDYVPMANVEPILFAVIDLGTDGCSGNEITFEVFKTRSDAGFAGWDFDAQLGLTTNTIDYTKICDNIAQATTTFYVDAIMDDAVRKYQLEIMNNSSLVESVMQLQMMVLQLSNAFQDLTGMNPLSIAQSHGYSVEAALAVDREYNISKTNGNNRMLLDAMAYRGVNTNGVEYINQANGLFSLNAFSANNPLNNGDIVKITLYNLDGSYYSSNGVDIAWWNGSIVFANYDGVSRVKIYELTSDLIKGIDYAKVTLMFSFSSSLEKWVLETVSIIDETSTVSPL